MSPASPPTRSTPSPWWPTARPMMLPTRRLLRSAHCAPHSACPSPKTSLLAAHHAPAGRSTTLRVATPSHTSPLTVTTCCVSAPTAMPATTTSMPTHPYSHLHLALTRWASASAMPPMAVPTSCGLATALPTQMTMSGLRLIPLPAAAICSTSPPPCPATLYN